MKDKSGSAFPQPYNKADGGMSLREYIATQAMAAIINGECGPQDILSTENINPTGVPLNTHGDKTNWDLALRWIPMSACAMADALLTELAKEGK